MTSVAHLELYSLQVSVFNRLEYARASLAGQRAVLSWLSFSPVLRTETAVLLSV